MHWSYLQLKQNFKFISLASNANIVIKGKLHLTNTHVNAPVEIRKQ